MYILCFFHFYTSKGYIFSHLCTSKGWVIVEILVIYYKTFVLRAQNQRLYLCTGNTQTVYDRFTNILYNSVFEVFFKDSVLAHRDSEFYLSLWVLSVFSCLQPLWLETPGQGRGWGCCVVFVPWGWAVCRWVVVVTPVQVDNLPATNRGCWVLDFRKQWVAQGSLSKIYPLVWTFPHKKTLTPGQSGVRIWVQILPWLQ